jgi:hypothetical protein
MRRRIRPIILTAALLVLTAAPAWAVPPNPNDQVVQVLGRKLYAYAPNGSIDGGHVSASAQGETVDGNGNGNGLADALRGRGALLERHGVTRLRMYSIRLQVLDAGTWEDVAIDDNDVVVGGEPAYLINYTPMPSFCPRTPPSPTGWCTRMRFAGRTAASAPEPPSLTSSKPALWSTRSAEARCWAAGRTRPPPWWGEWLWPKVIVGSPLLGVVAAAAARGKRRVPCGRLSRWPRRPWAGAAGGGCGFILDRVDAPWGMEQRRQKMPDSGVSDQGCD